MSGNRDRQRFDRSDIFGSLMGRNLSESAGVRATAWAAEAARKEEAQARAARFAATWTIPARTEVCCAELLDWLYDQSLAQPEKMLRFSDFYLDRFERGGQLAEVWGPVAVGDVLQSLQDDGLISIGPDKDIAITEHGRSDVESRQARRNDDRLRNAAARDALVKWLYGKEDYGSVYSIHQDLAATPTGYYEGRRLTQADLESAHRYLVEARLITDPSQSRSLGKEPRLTRLGVDCVEHYGGSVSDYLKKTERDRADVTEVHFHDKVSDSNLAIRGSDFKQSIENITESGTPASELTALVHALAQALPVLDLSADDTSRLTRDIQVVEAELVENQPNIGIIRTIMDRVLATLGSTADSSLALILGAYAKELMKKIGIPIE